LDTNVLVYLYSTAEPDKQTLAQALVNHHQTVISTQVLSELANVLRNKFKLDYPKIAAVIAEVTHASRVVTVTSDIIVKALQLAARYKYSFYDSLILATALTTPCVVLYSEDFQHGQVIESTLTIQNPFLGTCSPQCH
jgi:predicted nucleic acid-binding protein